MDLQSALRRSQVIDLTTTGARTGQPRRIGIFLHEHDGRLFLCGMPQPAKRAWLRNIEADPSVTVHLMAGIEADLAAVARPITDPAERRPLLQAAADRWGRPTIDDMMEHSPLVELTVSVPFMTPDGTQHER